MANKTLNGLDLVNLQNDSSAPQSGFAKVYIKDGKLFRRLPDGSVQQLSFKDEFSDIGETNPSYTYSQEGNLTRIDYASGSYKLFTYTITSVLSRVDFVKGSVTYRKDFSYDLFGNLTSITYSIV